MNNLISLFSALITLVIRAKFLIRKTNYRLTSLLRMSSLA
ncbi:hypothetical protein PMEGAPR236_53010 [Priestia megaterium]